MTPHERSKLNRLQSEAEDKMLWLGLKIVALYFLVQISIGIINLIK